MVPTNLSHSQEANPEFARIKAHLLGLTVACPYDLCNPAECPLCEIRTLTMRERFAWVESLSAGEVDALTNSHCDCLQKKVADAMADPCGPVELPPA